jgi:hypothetical protein
MNRLLIVNQHQPSATSQMNRLLIVNQHQPSATSQMNKPLIACIGDHLWTCSMQCTAALLHITVHVKWVTEIQISFSVLRAWCPGSPSLCFDYQLDWAWYVYTAILLLFICYNCCVKNCRKMCSVFVWLVADGWCWFVLREQYCWLIADGWFVLREKYCWLVADKPNEQALR